MGNCRVHEVDAFICGLDHHIGGTVDEVRIGAIAADQRIGTG
jgi:hypothetical protein